MAGRQESLTVTPRKFPLCSANSHPAVQKVGLTVLIRSAGPVAQYLVTRGLVVNLPLPGRSKEIDPVRLVQHRDELTSTTASRLVSGNLLQFESLKRSRNGVLSDVVRGGFPGEIVELVMRQPRWQILRHVVMVVGVGTGLAALYRNAPASIRAGHVGGYILM